MIGAPKEHQQICRPSGLIGSAELLQKHRSQPSLSSIWFTKYGITLNQPYLKNQMYGWDGLSLTPRPGSKVLLHSSVKLTANTKIKYTVWNKILRKQAEAVFYHPHFSGGVKRAKNCCYNLLNLTLQKSES